MLKKLFLAILFFGSCNLVDVQAYRGGHGGGRYYRGHGGDWGVPFAVGTLGSAIVWSSAVAASNREYRSDRATFELLREYIEESRRNIDALKADLKDAVTKIETTIKDMGKEITAQGNEINKIWTEVDKTSAASK